MKPQILHLILCGLFLLTVTQMQAQGSSKETATTISVGQQVTTTFPQGSVDLETTYWYKVPVSSGVWYELPWATSHSVYFSTDGTAGNAAYHNYIYPNYSYSSYVGLIYKPSENGYYFISIRYVASSPNPLVWNFEAISDNRICERASAVTLGDVVNVPTGQIYRWYKVDLEADKYYNVYNEPGTITAYNSCGGNQLFGSGGDVIYKASADVTAYMKIGNGIGEGGILTVLEVTPAANTTCANAKILTLGQQTEFAHTDRDLWFKVDLQAGLNYRISLPWAAQQTHIYVYDQCGNNPMAYNNRMAFRDGLSFTPPAAGTYYIKATYDPSYNPLNPADNIWLKIDLSPCQTAASVTAGQTVTYAHDAQDKTELWWKIDLQAGQYLIVRSGFHNNEFSVFSDCNSTTALNVGTALTIETAGSYYIQAKSGYVSTAETGTFNIVKLETPGTACAKAGEITLDQIIATSHPSNADAWYKISLTGGKVYQINDRNVPQNNDVSTYIYTSCGTTQEIASSSWYRNCIFLYPAANTTYYIKWTGTSNYSYSWDVSEVTDNRVCALATPLTAGQILTVPAYHESARPKTDDSAYKHYWYTLNVTAGKYYDFDFSQANYSQWNSDRIVIHNACGGREIASFNKSKTIVKATENAVWYVDVRSGSSSIQEYTFSIVEKMQGDNRVCEFANNVGLNTDITADHSTGSAYLWYKTNLNAGTVYEIDASNLPYGMNIYKDGVCGGQYEYDYQAGSVAQGKKSLFVPETTGVYYFKTGTEGNPSGSGTWKIYETEGDNRLCAYATDVILGAEFTVSHADYQTQWYKLEAAAGSMYEVNIPQTHYEYIYVYNQCGVENSIAFGYANTFTFTIQAVGTYYIRFSNDSGNPTFVCTVSEIADNRSCQHATVLAEGATATANSGDLWYNVSLTAGKYYEFNFTGTDNNNYVTASLYPACGSETTLDSGAKEKLLYKAAATASYLVKVKASGSSEVGWSYGEVANGDNRLCEFAEPINAGTAKIADFGNGFGRRWYKVNVNAGKYYQISEDAGVFYSGCEGEPIAMSYAETATTWYVLVQKDVWSSDLSKTFTVNELAPDGRVCAYGKEISVGETVTNENLYAYAVAANSYYSDYNDYVSNGTWYKLRIEEAGTYEIQLAGWEYYETHNDDPSQPGYYYGPFWAAYIANTCGDDGITPYISAAGHTFNTGRNTFEAAANSDIYILVDDWGVGHNDSGERTFKVIKKSVGNVVIAGSVKTDEETPISGAAIKLYRSTSQPSNAPQGVRRVQKSAVNTALWELIAIIHTDASGNYSFGNLAAGQYMLTVELDGYTMEEGAVVTASEDGTVSNVDFVADTETGAIIGSETGLNDVDMVKLQIYPNPVKDKLHIDLNGAFSSFRITISDVSGRMMYAFDHKNEQLLTVDVSELKAGIYLVTLIGDNKSAVMKVIKE